MAKQYPPLDTIILNVGTSFSHPNDLPEIIHIDDPALDAMIDFEHITAITIKPEDTISDALIEMKVCGVHLLLVIDDDNKVIGLISSEDILGDRAVKISQERRLPRNEILVSMLMTRQDDVAAINYEDLRHAKVGHLIETLHDIKQHYTIVVTLDEKTQQQTDRGLFSSSQLSKQLGIDVTFDLSERTSVAELQHEIKT